MCRSLRWNRVSNWTRPRMVGRGVVVTVNATTAHQRTPCVDCIAQCDLLAWCGTVITALLEAGVELEATDHGAIRPCMPRHGGAKTPPCCPISSRPVQSWTRATRCTDPPAPGGRRFEESGGSRRAAGRGSGGRAPARARRPCRTVRRARAQPSAHRPPHFPGGALPSTARVARGAHAPSRIRPAHRRLPRVPAPLHRGARPWTRTGRGSQRSRSAAPKRRVTQAAPHAWRFRPARLAAGGRKGGGGCIESAARPARGRDRATREATQ